MTVDPARRHHLAGRVDLLLARAEILAEGDDAAFPDPDVGLHHLARRRQRSVPEHQFVSSHFDLLAIRWHTPRPGCSPRDCLGRYDFTRPTFSAFRAWSSSSARVTSDATLRSRAVPQAFPDTVGDRTRRLLGRHDSVRPARWRQCGRRRPGCPGAPDRPDLSHPAGPGNRETAWWARISRTAVVARVAASHTLRTPGDRPWFDLAILKHHHASCRRTDRFGDRRPSATTRNDPAVTTTSIRPSGDRT